MPKTEKGKKILRAMKKTYKSKKKAESVFYASEKKGTITGVHKAGAKHQQQTGKLYKRKK